MRQMWKENRQLGLKLLIAFLIPVVLLLIWYSWMGFYPISDKSLLVSDLKQQYRSFFSYYQHLFSLKQSPFFSWDFLGGSNMIGNMGYYLGSLFNLVLLFFPHQLYFGIVTLLFLKIGATGLTTYLLVRKINPAQVLMNLALSTSFALCGMVIGYYFNILWLDAFVYLPLIFIGLLDLLNKKKISFLYIICLTLLLLANFYMAYMVGLFMLLYFLTQFWQKEKRNVEVLLRFVWMNLIALGLSAFLLMPTVIQLQKASTSHAPLLADWLNPFKVIAKLFNGVYYPTNVISDDIYPFIYAGLFCFLLVIPFFCMKAIKWQQKVSYGSLLLIVGFSLCYEPLGLVWQGFSKPTGFPYRFSFIFSFCLILIAVEVLKCIEKKDMKWIWLSFGCISLLWVILTLSLSSISFWLWGGNQGLLLLLTLFIYLWLLEDKKKLFAFLLLGTILIDCTTNAWLMSHKMGEISAFPTYYSDQHQESNPNPNVLQALRQDEAKREPFDKYQSTYHIFTTDNLFYGFPSVGGFTSMQSKDYGSMLQNMGFETTRVASKADSGTLLSNDFLGVNRYMQATYMYNERIPNAQKVVNVGDVSIYAAKTTRALGMQLASQEVTPEWGDAQEQIIKLMGEQPDKVARTTTPKLLQKNATLDESQQAYTKKEGTSQATLTYQLPKQSKDTISYISFSSPYSLDKITYNLSTQVKIQAHGFWKRILNGENKITIQWDGDQQFPVYGLKILTIDTKAWEAVEKREAKNDLKIKSKGLSSFEGTWDVLPNKTPVLRIPFDQGWHYTWNGKPVKAKRVLSDLTTLELPQGKGTLKGYYRPPGLMLGSIISGLSVVGLLAFYFYWKRRRKKR
ncbi:YfhO family protein [Listeria sp. PSOL-1]|uniref:YfhO family protein n=1 Tax=Listeria sp. PSOL-1 TaxID=1844999 RepID=UPI0013D3D22F|nr:YfhO family protein [Listeria sp. PSOL-1]